MSDKNIADKFLAFQASSDPAAAADIWFACLKEMRRTAAPELAPSAQQLHPVIINVREQVADIHAKWSSIGFIRRGPSESRERVGRYTRSGRRGGGGEYDAREACADSINDAASDACRDLINAFRP